MRTPICTFIAALLLLGSAQPAAAQPNARDLKAPPAVGRIELGANGALFLGPEGGWPTAGPQVVINFTRRDALQFGADVRHEHFSNWSNIMGFYSFAYRYTFSEKNGTRVFAVVGAGGLFERNHRDAYVFTSPAYTTTTNGVKTEHPAQTRDIPASTTWDTMAPAILLGGVGSETHLARRLTVQGQIVLIGSLYGGAGVRVSASLGVPLGRVSR